MTEQDPEALIEGFKDKLQSRWKQRRRQAYNSNTKGATFEKALRDFLLGYFDGIYEIRTRTAVIDRKLECFDVFNAGESELDVVASFRQAVPKVILESGDMKWVPYDGVAFVCEVKSKLTTSTLESDLEKLAKLNEIGRDNLHRRFSHQSTGRTQMYTHRNHEGKNNQTETTINHQLKCLVYDEPSISGEALLERLNTYTDIWDLVLIVDEDVILVSPERPFVEGWYKRMDEFVEDPVDAFPDILVLPDGVVWLVLILSVSIPRPLPFNASGALMQIVQREWKDAQSNQYSIPGAWHLLFDTDEPINLMDL